MSLRPLIIEKSVVCVLCIKHASYWFTDLALVVQRLDNDIHCIHRINRYPVDKC